MPISSAVFFSLMIVGATHLARLPAVGYLFAAFLGSNPLRSLLGPMVLGALTSAQQARLTGRGFFPSLISDPFKHGLTIILTFAIVMCLLAAWASWLRGTKYIHRELEPAAHAPVPHRTGAP